MILFRYLLREIGATMLAIVAVLLVVLISAQVLHYLQDVANGQITLAVLLKLMGLEIPLLLGYLLPLGFYLGVIMAIGRMCMEHEMTVLSAAGVSYARIQRSVFIIAVFVALITAWIMLSVEPKVQAYRIKMLNWAMLSYSLHKITPGQFQSVGDWEIYSGAASENRDVLKDLFFAHQVPPDVNHPQGSWEIVRAAAMTEKQDPVTWNNYILLHDGVQYQGAAPARDFQIISFAHYGMRLEEFERAASRKDQVKFLPTSELWRERNQAQSAAELQWRLAMPISILILPFLGLPLAQVNPRQGKFGRFFPAIFIYLLYMNMIFVTRDWIYNGRLSPQVGMWWLHGTLLCVALILMAQHIGWRRFVKLGHS